ncbi:probable 3',5'-cyclic adenosine monophosphate phosphodiesterase Cpd at N-terminal half [Coccomyxa sp. Obi]|nr:probable 3',5'-cyclic adenosine monophosphate phosphodiesterase Cpd at N-terminal half [Coccomyxa sp. Obi]
MATNSEAATLSSGLDPKYSARDVDEFTLAIVGDLHLERKGATMFERAREHLLDVLESGEGTPRSMACFRRAHEYISGFQPVPAALVVGNHDLEGEDFETDEENLAAWRQVFGQRHYWSMELSNVVCIGISTVRFRSNAFSAHEVYIDDEQLSWFKDTLSAAGQRPVIVFSHAPPLGCGLTVIQSVHVKNRCAFLNHSSNADVFMRLVEQHPNICLWFSGHFHLSHNYMRSISVSGNCAFVQTGVIGDCNRDGYRHSRVVKASKEGYQLYTMDHNTGELRLDLEHPWRSERPPQPILPPQDQLCDSEDECWPFDEIPPAAASRSNGAGNSGEQGTVIFERPASSSQQQRRWMAVGQGRLLSLEDSMLVEYNVASRAPIGVVFLSIEDGEEVVLVDRAGEPVVTDSVGDGNGEAVAAVELRDQSGRVTQCFSRTNGGCGSREKLRHEQRQQYLLASTAII